MIGKAKRFKKGIIFALAVAISFWGVAASLGLQGCGKDRSKQKFVDEIISIIEENQSQPEIGEKGKAAFMSYYQSGFTDLDSAAAAAKSFNMSNEKDSQSLASLNAMAKPDKKAEEIVDKLCAGIEKMDEGNAIFAVELMKAPSQSPEVRSNIFATTGQARELYLEGLETIIASCELLRDYIKSNGLDGVDKINKWIDKFVEEKKSLERQ